LFGFQKATFESIARLSSELTRYTNVTSNYAQQYLHTLEKSDEPVDGSNNNNNPNNNNNNNNSNSNNNNNTSAWLESSDMFDDDDEESDIMASTGNKSSSSSSNSNNNNNRTSSSLMMQNTPSFLKQQSDADEISMDFLSDEPMALHKRKYNHKLLLQNELSTPASMHAPSPIQHHHDISPIPHFSLDPATPIVATTISSAAAAAVTPAITPAATSSMISVSMSALHTPGTSRIFGSNSGVYQSTALPRDLSLVSLLDFSDNKDPVNLVEFLNLLPPHDIERYIQDQALSIERMCSINPYKRHNQSSALMYRATWYHDALRRSIDTQGAQRTRRAHHHVGDELSQAQFGALPGILVLPIPSALHQSRREFVSILQLLPVHCNCKRW
jgi:hypothetical protein